MGTMRKSRLSIYKQDRLIEHLLRERPLALLPVCAASIVKLRHTFFIVCARSFFSNLNKKAWQCVRGRLKLMKAILVVHVRGSVEEGRQEKSLYFDYLSVVERSIQR